MLKDLFRQYRVENWNAVLSVLRKILSEAGMLRRKVKTLDECRKQLPAELLPLFDELRRVRAKKSRETGMPAYAVASNVSLEMICRELPDSMESLRKIKGMGPKNSAICGEEFISCIEKHKKGAGSKEAGSSETAGWYSWWRPHTQFVLNSLCCTQSSADIAWIEKTSEIYAKTALKHTQY